MVAAGEGSRACWRSGDLRGACAGAGVWSLCGCCWRGGGWRGLHRCRREASLWGPCLLRRGWRHSSALAVGPASPCALLGVRRHVLQPDVILFLLLWRERWWTMQVCMPQRRRGGTVKGGLCGGAPAASWWCCWWRPMWEHANGAEVVWLVVADHPFGMQGLQWCWWTRMAETRGGAVVVRRAGEAWWRPDEVGDITVKLLLVCCWHGYRVAHLWWSGEGQGESLVGDARGRRSLLGGDFFAPPRAAMFWILWVKASPILGPAMTAC
ncbi:hypothetical protein C2845_PM07G07920 [Panicum miliaceum]|uniref:Uncharacterized protein n=1 Tax=Panicum miliaceum TaxID=4540 RepID=A0A3L6SNA3_PANMI|nr:hypothetical protein C2845_PM07G07920 [Panicum miliaceum]